MKRSGIIQRRRSLSLPGQTERQVFGPKPCDRNQARWKWSFIAWSELQQIVAQVLVGVGLAGQAAALQLGHQAVADLDDVAAVEVAVEDQEAVAADLLHQLLH